MDELDEAVYVFSRDLSGRVSSRSTCGPSGIQKRQRDPYRLVLLVEIVHVAIQDLHEQLHRHRRVHARIRHPQRPLQALEHALPIPIQGLWILLAAAPDLRAPP